MIETHNYPDMIVETPVLLLTKRNIQKGGENDA